jgi:hypothetical protein
MLERAMADWVPVEGRATFLKKRSKKPLPLGTRGPFRNGRVSQSAKVFWFFFSKKNNFLSF